MDPVTAAYWREYQEQQAKETRKKKPAVPDFVKELPEYRKARAQQIGAIVTLGVGGGMIGGGLIWLIAASLKGCGFFQSCTPDRGGQAGGGILMGFGVVGMFVGGTLFSVARTDKQKIVDKYVPPSQSRIQIQLGLGSMSLGTAF